MGRLEVQELGFIGDAAVGRRADRGLAAKQTSDAELDRLALLAAQVLVTPVAVVSLIEDHEQSVPVRIGLPAPWISVRGASHLCRSVTMGAQPLVLPTSRAIRRANQNGELVDPGVAACLGAPLMRADGRACGALCVIDRRPRAWRPSHVAALVQLAGAITVVLELRALVAHSGRHQEIEQAKAELLSSVAHDLQQPLTTVKLQAQLLQRAMRDGPTPSGVNVLADLGRIVAAADRMADQLKELLDLSSAQLGWPVSVERRPTDLVGLTQQAVADHQRGAEATAMVVATGQVTLVGSFDPAALRRVLDNLLGNAIKYSPGGRSVIAKLDQEDGPGGSYAVLEIRDQGIGIPAADLAHVTERFYRGTNVAGIVAGSGIGLAAARQIVEDHDGSLTVESTEGRGTTVTVRLPLAVLGKDG
jgi:signal transduction histidine kinase